MRIVGLIAGLLLSLASSSAQTPTITTSSIPGATIGIPYNTQLHATGGVPPYTWRWVQFSGVPPFMSISSDGVLSGTPGSLIPVGSVYTINVQVNDGANQSATRQFTFTVQPPSNLAIATTPLPPGSVGVPYPATTLAATGGTPPYQWSTLPGSLPAGLGIDANSGTIRGTPANAGNFSPAITVTDANGHSASSTFSLVISGARLTITTPSLPDGTVGVAYPPQTLTASGGTPPYSWSWSPAVPGLSPINGVISGTPTQAGQYAFTLQVTDANYAIEPRTFTIAIRQASLIITTPSLPAATVGGAYPPQTLTASGGTQPYSWSMPPAVPGLDFGNYVTIGVGVISGTPTQPGQYTFTVKVTDANNATDTKTFTVTVKPAGAALLTITTDSPLPNATVGKLYQQAISATAGTQPYKWRFVLGSLLGFISAIDPDTGVVSGTPQASDAGKTIVFDVQVTDATGQAATKRFTVVAIGISTGPLKIATTSPLPDGSVGLRYWQPSTATGGSLPYQWSWTGNTPSGLNIDGASGTISGVPTTTGTFTFTVQVTDSQGADDAKQFTLTVGIDPNIVPTGPQPVVAPMALAVDSAHQLVYIANWGAYKSNGEDMTYLGALPTNMVTVMEEGSGKVVNSYPIGNTKVGDALGIAVDSGRGRVYVTNRGDATLSIVDTARNSVSPAGVGSGPMGVAVDPATGVVYVANNAGKTVTVLDAAGKTLGIVPVDGNPSGVAVDGTTHQAYVALDQPPALAVLQGTTRITQVGLGNLARTSMAAVAVDPGSRVYVHIGNGTIAMFNTSSGAPQYMGSFSADNQYADGVAVDTTYHLVYVSATLSDQVNVFTGDGTPVYTLSAGRSPTGIAIDPLARRGYVANTFANSVSTIDLASRTVTPGSNANTSVPSGMAFDSGSRRLFLGNWEGDSLTVMDVDAKTIKANWPTKGHKPWAVALDTDLQQAYVLNAGDGGTLSIMDMNDGTVKALIGFPQPNPGDSARNGSVAVSPSTHKVYVATGTDSLDTVLIIDGKARTLLRALSVGDTRVSGVAVDDRQGIAYVLSNYYGLITLVSVWNDQIVDQWQMMDDVNPDIPNRGWLVAADPDRSRIYVTVPHVLGSFTGVVAIDTAQVAILWRTPAPDYTTANAVVMNPATGHVCYTALNEIGPLDSVVCLQPDAGQVVQTIQLGRHADIRTGTLAGFFAVDKDSSNVYVTNSVGGTFQIIGDK